MLFADTLDDTVGVALILQQPPLRVGTHPGPVDLIFVEHGGKVGPDREQQLLGPPHGCRPGRVIGDAEWAETSSADLFDLLAEKDLGRQHRDPLRHQSLRGRGNPYRELVGEADLALVMGAQQARFATSGAAGPAVGGILLDISHCTPVLLLTTAGLLAAATAIATGARPRPTRPSTASSGLGAVALLVGAVGVANIMIISVLERRSEIGLRRALGATRGHIRTQFLSEAVLLGLLGGTVSVALGAAATAVYAHTKHWATIIPIEAWAGGIAASLIIGALAGLVPALRAARLSPTEALWSV